MLGLLVSALSRSTAARQSGFQAKLLNELASGTLRPLRPEANQIHEIGVAEPQFQDDRRPLIGQEGGLDEHLGKGSSGGDARRIIFGFLTPRRDLLEIQILPDGGSGVAEMTALDQ